MSADDYNKQEADLNQTLARNQMLQAEGAANINARRAEIRMAEPMFTNPVTGMVTRGDMYAGMGKAVTGIAQIPAFAHNYTKADFYDNYIRDLHGYGAQRDYQRMASNSALEGDPTLQIARRYGLGPEGYAQTDEFKRKNTMDYVRQSRWGSAIEKGGLAAAGIIGAGLLLAPFTGGTSVVGAGAAMTAFGIGAAGGALTADNKSQQEITFRNKANLSEETSKLFGEVTGKAFKESLARALNSTDEERMMGRSGARDRQTDLLMEGVTSDESRGIRGASVRYGYRGDISGATARFARRYGLDENSANELMGRQLSTFGDSNFDVINRRVFSRVNGLTAADTAINGMLGNTMSSNLSDRFMGSFANAEQANMSATSSQVGIFNSLGVGGNVEAAKIATGIGNTISAQTGNAGTLSNFRLYNAIAGIIGNQPTIIQMLLKLMETDKPTAYAKISQLSSAYGKKMSPDEVAKMVEGNVQQSSKLQGQLLGSTQIEMGKLIGMDAQTFATTGSIAASELTADRGGMSSAIKGVFSTTPAGDTGAYGVSAETTEEARNKNAAALEADTMNKANDIFKKLGVDVGDVGVMLTKEMSRAVVDAMAISAENVKKILLESGKTKGTSVPNTESFPGFNGTRKK